MPARRHFAVANTAPTRGTDTVVDVAQKLSRFRDHWSPRIVGQLNDLHVKVAKVEGEFVWHDHPDTDELFYVVAGTLHIEVRDDPAKPEDVRTVAIPAGSFYVVPKGVEHKPVAREECHIMLLEPAGTVNTGNAEGTDNISATDGEWL